MGSLREGGGKGGAQERVRPKLDPKGGSLDGEARFPHTLRARGSGEGLVVEVGDSLPEGKNPGGPRMEKSPGGSQEEKSREGSQMEMLMR